VFGLVRHGANGTGSERFYLVPVEMQEQGFLEGSGAAGSGSG
jgi:hypothetical protein